MRVAAEILRDQKKPIFVQGEDSKLGLIEGFKEFLEFIDDSREVSLWGLTVSGRVLTLVGLILGF